MPLTRDAYRNLIRENLVWLESLPRTLEREHVIAIVNASEDHEYGSQSSTEELTATKLKLALAEARVKELEKVAEAGWRLCCFNYQPWFGAGGRNECRHGISEHFRCQRCDEMTVRNACSSGGTVKETLGEAMPRKD